jgi:hypothetical protein
MMMEFCSHYVVRLILALSAQICVLQSFAPDFQKNLHTVCWIGPVFTTVVFGSIGLTKKASVVFFGLQEEWCCTRVRSLK